MLKRLVVGKLVKEPKEVVVKEKELKLLDGKSDRIDYTGRGV